MNILHIDSCALGDHSASRRYTAAVIAQLTAAHPQVTVLHRDLAAAPLSHASGPLLQVLSQRWDTTIPMSAELRAEALQSASLLQEFHDAAVVVIGAPMHNFSVPSTLKAWMDRLLELQAGSAQRGDARVVLVTSGCTETHMEELMNHHEAQLKAALGALGISELEVVRNSPEQAHARDLKSAA
jgi:FMN-dependent NADH-azoreductase